MCSYRYIIFVLVFIWSSVFRAATIPNPTSKAHIPLGCTGNYRTSPHNNSRNGLADNLVPDPFFYHDHGFSVIFSGYEEPSFAAQDVYTLLRQARIDLDTIRRQRGDRMTDDIDDHTYRYANPSLGGGMQWIITQDPERTSIKNLTYQMVEIVRFGTGRLVAEFGTQRVKSNYFLLWLHQTGGSHYIAEGGLNNDIEGNVMSSQSKAQR